MCVHFFLAELDDLIMKLFIDKYRENETERQRDRETEKDR